MTTSDEHRGVAGFVTLLRHHRDLQRQDPTPPLQPHDPPIAGGNSATASDTDSRVGFDAARRIGAKTEPDPADVGAWDGSLALSEPWPQWPEMPGRFGRPRED